MTATELQSLLEDSGAILNGHFLLTSGRHSNRYIEKFRVLEKPDTLDKVCQEMAAPYKNKNVEIVLGAAIGGILISGGVGRHLGVKHIFSERVNGKMELRRGFNLHDGVRVLIVEDIITTGGSVFELVQLVKEYNAEIVGVVNLVERSAEPIEFGVPSTPLLNLPSESWEEKECPLCKDNIKFTKRGRTGK
ncbi:orotate phosphoribosyltransferase [Candidatus Marinimicrobia bacterium]|nr:orotate phosphoribosyltransferase [Candidatus Neomarinimicrobiota bacterium]